MEPKMKGRIIGFILTSIQAIAGLSVISSNRILLSNFQIASVANLVFLC